jgi:hypothetical protein
VLAGVIAAMWPVAILRLESRAFRSQALARSALAVCAIAALAFVAQVPLITAPYYPRVIMLSYYLLATFGVAVALSWRCRPGTACGSPPA